MYSTLRGITFCSSSALAARYAQEKATDPHAKHKETKRLLDAADTLPGIYKTNEETFSARKKEYGAARADDLLKSELLLARPLSEGRNANPEPYDEDEEGEEGEWLEWTNLPEPPRNAAGEPLLFVCRVAGYVFHEYGEGRG